MEDKQFTILDKKIDEIKRNTTPNYNGYNITLYDWSLQWLNCYKKDVVKDTTYKKYKDMVSNLPSRLLTRELAEIKASDLNAYLISFGQKSRYKQCFYTLLFDIFARAVDNDLLEKNPLRTIPKPKHTKKKKSALTREDEEIFIKECLKEKHGDMFIIMLLAGLRKGEAAALYYSDIDIKQKLIHITKGIDDNNKMSTPKSQASIRKVPIFNNLLPYLLKYENNNENKRIFNIADVNIYKHFNKIIARCGFTKGKYTTHSLRHTFATRCAERNINVKMTQQMLGHSTYAITADIYQHINKDFEISQIELMNMNIEKEREKL